jgi:hypothetical protein
MNSVFGTGACYVLNVRQTGASRVIPVQPGSGGALK